MLDTCNDQTFGGSFTSIVQKPPSSSGQKPTSSSGKGYGVWLTSFLKVVSGRTVVDIYHSFSIRVRAARYLMITLVTFPLNSDPSIFLPEAAV